MRASLTIVSLIALLGSFVPSILYQFQMMALSTASAIALGATLIWFVVTPMWMGKKR